MTAPRLLAGASGFAYKPWKGPFYPERLPDAEMLPYYAERLPTVEINNTFYRLPKAAMLEDWAARTPPEFRFVIKASQRITHMQRLKDCGETLAYLHESTAALGDKLAAIFYQLPPNLKKDTPRLEAFLDLLPAHVHAAFEFRHESWFADDVYAALAAHGHALCVGEFDDKGKDTPRVATAQWGYLRLRREAYDDSELTDWWRFIAAQAWDEAYVFFKHEDEGAAPKFALRLMDLAAR